MTPEDIARRFTRPDGRFRFARWSRPVVPMVYGADAASQPVLKAGMRLIADLAGMGFGARDPETGFNHHLILVADWRELTGVPELERLLPGSGALGRRLAADGAQVLRQFRRAPGGGIAGCLTLMRVAGPLAELPADLLALGHAVESALDWAPGALADGITRRGAAGAELRPELIALLRAAYDPRLPDASEDASLALRLAARVAA
jgi:hypothetical protein